jgi:uncharacterized protein YbgA (DUF1722 family)
MAFTRRALLDFHSRYKLQLLAHHQAGYREIGPFVPRCTSGKTWTPSSWRTGKS